MKFVFRWLFRLLLLAVVLAVVLVLSLDSILRVLVQHNIRSQTGMEAEIGKFHLGLIEPVVTIQNLKLYNPPDFGGTPFLNIPEIHVEYDRATLAKKQIHITLLRFNLGELDIVKNEAGRTNIFSIGLALPKKDFSAKSKDLMSFKQRADLNFPKIDVLNVWVGTFKFIDLKNQRNNREQKIGIENLVMTRTDVKKYAVQSPEDIAGLVALVYLRCDDFFKSVLIRQKQDMNLLKLFGY